MSHREGLLTAALLGTEQQLCPDLSASGALGDCFAELTKNIAELGNARTILHAAALMFVYERSGLKLQKFQGSFAQPCDDEELPYISPIAAGHLKVLFDRQEDLLPEWLSVAQSCNKIVSEDSIISLLRLGEKISAYHPKIVSLIGKKGRWLAQFNPVWAFVHGSNKLSEQNIPELEQAWELGDSETRTYALSNIRTIDPLFALELLSSTWKVDSGEDRRRFLYTFHTNLSMEDEDFIESHALEDKRKEVRQLAQELLSKLPNSRWSKRVRRRALECLDFVPTFKATPPLDCDKDMQRDGVVFKSGDTRLGEKAWWLSQVIGQANPRDILAEYNLDEQQLISAFSSSEWKLALRTGLESAIIKYRDIAFAKVLLTTPGAAEHETALFVHLDNEAKQDVVAYMAERDGFILIKQNGAQWDSTSQKFLSVMRFPWSKTFSKCVLRCVRTHMTQKNNYLFMETIMRHIGTYMDTDVWAEVKESWASSAKYDPSLETMMWILSFRQEMKDALRV